MTPALPVTAALLLAAATAVAGDQPWDAAAEKAWRSRDLVPATIETKTKIFDGGGEKLEVVDEVEHLDGWSNGEPVMKKDERRTSSRSPGSPSA